MKYIISILIILYPHIIFGETIQYFNPEIFGQSIHDTIVLLRPAKNNAVSPLAISTDIKEGKYSAATVTYPKEISFQEVKTAIKNLYKDAKEKSFDSGKMIVFRNEKNKFAISLTENDSYIQVIYIPFMETEEIIKTISEVAKELKSNE